MGSFKDYLEQDMMGGGMGGPPGGGMDAMGGMGGGMPPMGGPPGGGPGMGGALGGPGMGMDPMAGGMGAPGMPGPETAISVEPKSIWDIWAEFFGVENKDSKKAGNDPSDMLQSGPQEQEPKQSEFLMSAPGVT